MRRLCKPKAFTHRFARCEEELPNLCSARGLADDPRRLDGVAPQSYADTGYAGFWLNTV